MHIFYKHMLTTFTTLSDKCIHLLNQVYGIVFSELLQGPISAFTDPHLLTELQRVLTKWVNNYFDVGEDEKQQQQKNAEAYPAFLKGGLQFVGASCHVEDRGWSGRGCAPSM